MKKIFVVILCVVGGLLFGGRASAASCVDIEFMFARGSGGKQYETAEFNAVADAALAITNEYYLSTRTFDLDYPAVDVNNPIRLIGAFVSAGKAYEFGESVSAGVASLQELYRTRHAECPEMKFILVGYSQGAMVVSQALSDFNADDVKFVMLLGDPNTYLPEGKGLFPEACNGGILSQYRTYAPNCRTHEGVLGGRKPYELAALSGKYSLWCNREDYICGSSKNPLRNSGHMAYPDKIGWGMAHLARKYLEKYTPTEIRPLSLRSAPLNNYLDDVLVDDSGGANITAPDVAVWREGDVLKMKWSAPEKAKDLLLRLNGVDLGYVDAGLGAFEIRDIDFSSEYDLSFVWMDSTGELGEAADDVGMLEEEPVWTEDVVIVAPEASPETPVVPVTSETTTTTLPSLIRESPQVTYKTPENRGIVALPTKKANGLTFADKSQIVTVLFSMLGAGGLLTALIVRKRRG